MSQADRAPSTPPDAPHADDAGPAPGSDAATVGSDDALGKTVAELTADDVEPGQRRGCSAGWSARSAARGVGQLFQPKVALQWMADAVSDIAPHVPVRDLETLRRHHDGLDGEALAERLVRNAARATAGVGAAGGGVAAVEWAATPDPAVRAGAAGRRDGRRGRHRAQADRRAARGVRQPIPGSRRPARDVA